MDNFSKKKRIFQKNKSKIPSSCGSCFLVVYFLEWQMINFQKNNMEILWNWEGNRMANQWKLRAADGEDRDWFLKI